MGRESDPFKALYLSRSQQARKPLGHTFAGGDTEMAHSAIEVEVNAEPEALEKQGN